MKTNSTNNAELVARAMSEVCKRVLAGKKLKQKNRNIGLHLGKRLQEVSRIWDPTPANIVH